jgi:hypothetical protein
MSGDLLGSLVVVRAKPRAVFVPRDSESPPVVQGVFPYEHVLDVGSGELIHSEDWEVIVTEADDLQGNEQLFGVGFGVRYVQGVQQWLPSRPAMPDEVEDPSLQTKRIAAGIRTTVSVGSDPTPSQGLLVPPGLDPIVERLVRTDLVPGFQEGQPWLPLEVPRGFGNVSFGFKTEWFLTPLLVASNGAVLAARVRRSPVSPSGQLPGEMWILPSWVTKHREWLQAAWRVWATEYPGRFPKSPQWGDSATWYTPEEAAIHDQILLVRSERDQAVARFDAEEASLAEALDRASVLARDGAKRLLTADGDPLCEAVAEVLRELGFDVVDMDAQVEEGKRVEDLRVREGDWEAIAEVKGDKRGAALRDLLKIGRFAGLYEGETGHAPSAQWFIVNGMRLTDPGLRPLPLAGSTEDIDLFAEGGGVIISTVDLFQVWCEVKAGRREKEEVRQVMREAKGRFTVESLVTLV